jgi:predicted nucleic acid-binding protein
MILADTSVWVDHLRSGDLRMAGFLDQKQIVIHPFIIGEVALGFLKPRGPILADLHAVPRSEVATDAEVLELIERHALVGTGIGYVDAHLLAAAHLTIGASFWTRDKRLLAMARKTGLKVTT